MWNPNLKSILVVCTYFLSYKKKKNIIIGKNPIIAYDNGEPWETGIFFGRGEVGLDEVWLS